MNVLLPDSARCQENNENYFCARGARPNFRIFREEIFLHLYFLVSKFATWRFGLNSRLFQDSQRNSRLFPDFLPENQIQDFFPTFSRS